MSSSSFAKIDIHSDSRRVQKVQEYINTHYQEEIRLGQLADMVGMTDVSFSRFFKLRTGKNLSDYSSFGYSAGLCFPVAGRFYDVYRRDLL